MLMMVGMNDVLPKPFTKEGLLQMLEHQLAHLTRPKTGQQAQQQAQLQQPSQGQNSHGSIPTQLNFNNPPHGMHHDQLPDHPNTGNGLKYSVSPAPSKSPGTAGIYSTGRSPTDMAEDAPQQVQSQAGGMEEPGGGYMGMMGGYMPEESTHGHSYQSPAQGQRRLADDDMYGPIKKQQRY